jgi:hypothetical protein
MIKKHTLENLYVHCKLSMSEISVRLQVSPSTVDWWMKKHGIQKRSRSLANYEKYNKDGDPFKIAKIDTLEKSILYGVGVGLFWGEGNKVSKNSLRLGNTDPELIKTYVRFLKVICGVRDSKIRFGLQLFNDSNQEKAIMFWTKTLKVKRTSFMPTISVVAPQGSGTYRKKNEYGVVTVYVNNIKLLSWMHKQLYVFK